MFAQTVESLADSLKILHGSMRYRDPALGNHTTIVHGRISKVALGPSISGGKSGIDFGDARVRIEANIALKLQGIAGDGVVDGNIQVTNMALGTPL